MESLIDNYIDLISDTNEFKRLLELKKIIDTKYPKEIIAFKTAESKYNEALDYGKYYPGIDNLRRSLSEKKTILYNKEEVKEYLELERKLDKMLNDDLNELKKSISNKFKTNERFSL